MTLHDGVLVRPYREVYASCVELQCVNCNNRLFLGWLGPKGPAKILEVTLMRPIHGNL